MSQKWCFLSPRQLTTCQILCTMPFLPHSPSNSYASFNDHFQVPAPCNSFSPRPDHSRWQLSIPPSCLHQAWRALRPGPRSDALSVGPDPRRRLRGAIGMGPHKPLMICSCNSGVPLRPALQEGRQGCNLSKDHSSLNLFWDFVLSGPVSPTVK